MNKVFGIHYNGQLTKVYRKLGSAKSYMTKMAKRLKSYNKESEIDKYEIVGYVPEITTVSKYYTIDQE